MGSGLGGPIQWICKEPVQELGFDETTTCVESGDGQVGIKNTRMDGLLVWGNELLARWYELPSSLIHQRHKGGTWVSFIPPPFFQPPSSWVMVWTSIWFDSPEAWRRNLGLLHPPPLPAPFFVGDLSPYMVFFRSILILHLLVILAHTWVHVPLAAPSDVLWAAVTQIALSRGHVYVSGARMLAVGI